MKKSISYWAFPGGLEGTKDIGQSGKKVIDTGTDLGKDITDAFKGLLKPKEENK